MLFSSEKDLDFYYNYLNLTSAIVGATGAYYYTWLADGTKVESSDEQSGKKLIYLGSLRYDTSTGEKSTGFAGGTLIVSSVPADSKALLYVKDHLGSVRVIVDKGGRPAVFNEYQPFGLLDKDYSVSTFAGVDFPDADNCWLYNGKEQDVLASSGLLDYGARLYDPALARWISVDPLAESSVSMSPFAYCYNNPINVIDPDGMYGTMIVSPSGVSSQDWTTLHGGVTYEQWCEGRDQYSGGLYFIGEATSDLLQEIEKISTLRFSVAANGQVSAKGRPKNDADRKLLEIINNQFVMVLIESMKGVQSSQGVNVFGGAFAGSELYKNFSISKQVVAPEALSAIDTAIGKPGYTVMHEIDEAYIGGRLAHAEQIDVPPAYEGQENRIYKRAHASTYWYIPDGALFYYDSNNNRVYDRAQASSAYLMISINGAYKEVMPWPL